MIHPEFSAVKSHPAVARAASVYKAAVGAATKIGGQHSYDWADVKLAESALNEAVEDARCTLRRT